MLNTQNKQLILMKKIVFVHYNPTKILRNTIFCISEVKIATTKAKNKNKKQKQKQKQNKNKKQNPKHFSFRNY